MPSTILEKKESKKIVEKIATLSPQQLKKVNSFIAYITGIGTVKKIRTF